MRYEIAPHYHDKKEFLLKIKSHFNQADQSIHKARNEIKIIDNFVVKSFKVPHFINKIAYTFFRASKAKKSFHNSLKLATFTPSPVGYIEYRRYGLISHSFYISEHFIYDFTIREVLTTSHFKDKESIFKAFAHFSYTLHEKGIKHLDYSPGNILIQKKANHYLFKIVDVNRMQFKKLSTKERLENFAKLWAKDEDLKIIILAYAKYANLEFQKAYTIAQKASQHHKNKKNFKKRLKGIEVVD